MVEKISSYIENIIILVIVMTIIELILPNSRNKKYVMFACSLVIMMSVINPILGVFNSDIDVSTKINEIQEEIKKQEYSYATNYDVDANIYNTYVKKLKINIEKRLEDIGYQVLDSNIVIDKVTYEPTEIEMKIRYKDGYIQPIVIDVFENSKSNNLYEIDINRIKEILSLNYGFGKEKIKINE